MKIAEIMTLDPETISYDASLDDALGLMDEHDVRHLPVVRDGRLVGVLSDRDLLGATGWLPARVHEARGPGVAESLPSKVGEVQHADPVTIDADEDVVQAAVEFVGRRIGCLPVLDEEKLVGIVSEMDMIRAFSSLLRAGKLPTVVDPPVSQRMAEHPTTLTSATSLGEARKLMRSNDVRHLPVLENGMLAGMLSDRDLRGAEGCGRRPDLAVEEVMVRGPVTVATDARMSAAARIMGERRFSALPVVEDGALVGILTLTDLLDHCMTVLQEPAPAGGA